MESRMVKGLEPLDPQLDPPLFVHYVSLMMISVLLGLLSKIDGLTTL
jgi:hypothetical protein